MAAKDNGNPRVRDPDPRADRRPANDPHPATANGAANVPTVAPPDDHEVDPADVVRPSPAATVAERVLDRFAAAAGSPDTPAAEPVAFVHFDTPAAEDDAITVLLPKESMHRLPAQSLVRIVSPAGDGDAPGDALGDPAAAANPAAAGASRQYLGVVVAGPFAEPDGLKADSSLVVATTVSGHGGVLLPRYHGRALVQLLGEIEPEDHVDADFHADAEDVGDRPIPDSDHDATDHDAADLDLDDEEARFRAARRASASSAGSDVGPTAAAPRVFPPRHRPRPNSPVYPLGDAAAAAFLRCGGGRPADARLGVIVGRERVAVSLPTDRKHVLPRHTGILGTTGGGKSTTVAGLVARLAAAGVATVVIDVEGEYTELDRPTDDPAMLAALARRGLVAAGVRDLHVLHPVGRASSREAAGRTHPFSLRWSDLSPHAVTELLEMPDAQQERFLKCFDVTRAILKDLRVFPATRDEEDQMSQIDELETGWPRMTLAHLIDVANVFAHQVAKDEGDVPLYDEVLAAHASKVKQRVAAVKSSHEFSWRGLIGRLHRVHRLRVFDNPKANPLKYAGFLKPGRVSVVDLSDTDEPSVRNLVIADVLRGIQREQERAVAAAAAEGRPPTPVVVVIEEAHEFLSAQRAKQMPTLFQQVARIARRGRKRWLGLVFVTQLPQHLPDEVLGLINNWVLHKISDAGVIDRLRKSISGLDRGQWGQVAGLAPGQAVVSLTSWAGPLVVSVDPAPGRLRLVE